MLRRLYPRRMTYQSISAACLDESQCETSGLTGAMAEVVLILRDGASRQRVSGPCRLGLRGCIVGGRDGEAVLESMMMGI